MLNTSVQARQFGDRARTRWLEQTLERVDEELVRDDVRAEPPFIVGELVEFRGYLQDELAEARGGLRLSAAR